MMINQERFLFFLDRALSLSLSLFVFADLNLMKYSRLLLIDK